MQQVEFESDDPAFAGTMKMTWTLTEVPGGTEVAIFCENVPVQEYDRKITQRV